jgi:hypothetical protein
MSLREEREILLSQLVDGELPIDQANELLAETLGELADVLSQSEACQRLATMLELRRAMGVWRRQENTRPVITLPPVENASWRHGRALSLIVAAVLGGVLVAGGFYLGNRLGGERAVVVAAQKPVLLVTPEQRREIAQAFALHESVAGPLSWYAADDATIELAPALKGEKLQPPIAVVIRLAPAQETKDTPSKTYVIVCRSSDAATIELPQSTIAKTVRLWLMPKESNGQVSVQYALAADDTGHGPDDASLAGRRPLGLGQTALGQLAMNDRLVNVDASAWVVRDN